jgi:hypothetical protein
MNTTSTPSTPAAPTAPTTPPAAAPPVVPKTKRKKKSPIDTAGEYRNTNLPHIKNTQVWSSQSGGWASVPRSAGLISTLVIKEAYRNRFNGSSAAGVTYMTLWLHFQGHGMSRIESEADAALESGYGGERGITTFRRHLRTLKDLGFVDYLEESRGRVKWVALLNPYQVVKKLVEDGHVSKATYSALKERADAIGVSDEFADAAEASDVAE